MLKSTVSKESAVYKLDKEEFQYYKDSSLSSDIGGIVISKKLLQNDTEVVALLQNDGSVKVWKTSKSTTKLTSTWCLKVAMPLKLKNSLECSILNSHKAYYALESSEQLNLNKCDGQTNWQTMLELFCNWKAHVSWSKSLTEFHVVND